MELQLTTWIALVTVSVIAILSAGLGLLLFRFSSAVVTNRSIRITGATAIAWVFFLGMGKFYVTVSKDLQQQRREDKRVNYESIVRTSKEVEAIMLEYRECALHVGDFKCKEPADRLQNSCESLLSQFSELQ
jgi:hypothetical protein